MLGMWHSFSLSDAKFIDLALTADDSIDAIGKVLEGNIMTGKKLWILHITPTGLNYLNFHVRESSRKMFITRALLSSQERNNTTA
jgi:hypothetical protein